MILYHGLPALTSNSMLLFARKFSFVKWYFKWNIRLCRMWNNVLPHIVKYCSFVAMWNEINPLTRRSAFHTRSIFLAQSAFHKSRKGFISLKKAHIVLVDKCVLFFCKRATMRCVKRGKNSEKVCDFVLLTTRQIGICLFDDNFDSRAFTAITRAFRNATSGYTECHVY